MDICVTFSLGLSSLTPPGVTLLVVDEDQGREKGQLVTPSSKKDQGEREATPSTLPTTVSGGETLLTDLEKSGEWVSIHSPFNSSFGVDEGSSPLEEGISAKGGGGEEGSVLLDSVIMEYVRPIEEPGPAPGGRMPSPYSLVSWHDSIPKTQGERHLGPSRPPKSESVNDMVGWLRGFLSSV